MRRPSETPLAMLPLELAYGTIEYTLPVPTKLYQSACTLRDQYIFSLDQTIGSQDTETKETEVPETTKELVLGFLVFLTKNGDNAVSLSILQAFERTLLGNGNIHTVVARTNRKAAAKVEILRCYFHIKAMASESRDLEDGNHPMPALIQAVQDGKASLVPIFGGQGNTDDLLDELRSLHSTYRPLVDSLFLDVSRLLLNLSQDPRTGDTYLETGFDLLAWLENPPLQPKKEDVLSAGISFPLIGLLGLAHYTVFCKLSHMSPGEARRYFHGTTGHSQGIVVAAAIALASSWESFERISAETISLLFWIGFRSQETWHPATPSPSLVSEHLECGEGKISPMLKVRGLKHSEIQKHLDAVNSHFQEDQFIYVSLINSSTNIIVSGPPNSLSALCRRLRSLESSVNKKAKAESRVTLRFLSTNVPFHSPYLSKAREQILEDVNGIDFKREDLGMTVYDTRSGNDLRMGTSQSLIQELVSSITTACVDWPSATKFEDVTHVLDFGPGYTTGIGATVRENSEGLGIRLIFATVLQGPEVDVGFQSELYSLDAKDVRFEDNWATKYAPALIKTRSGHVIDNKFSRFFGMPPLMVAGMTPTTAHWDFVAATSNAGYHAELAGGGYFNAAAMESAIKKISHAVTPGRGVTCNLIYASPQSMAWQIPLIRKLNGEGENIVGITIGAGVPSLDVANEYIRSLNLRHISFKPGTIEAIQQVIVIAKANPKFPVILQWTGGRGGGHHSKEDFHKPLIHMYGRVRRCPNIIFVVGSGFGSGEDTYPYLSGTWSRNYGLPCMPFDGILFGSRVMTALEAHTSIPAKEAIVAAPGVDDAQWDKSYERPTGGVITVTSEMGEPIHKLATRGVLFWAEMDAKIFSLDRKKRVAALKSQEGYIKARLDRDFQKPWFAKKLTNELVELEDMTYQEVLIRLASLLYITSRMAWIDETYKSLFFKFFRRVEERLSTKDSASLIASIEQLGDPHTFTALLASRYPAAVAALVKTQDAEYFLSICKTKGQKPVPFVPRLDEDFETWMKKDSLWQSENIDAVVDQDAGRTCILHGPVAAKYSTKINEPIKEILDSIKASNISSILAQRYSGEINAMPRTEHFEFEQDALPHPAVPDQISVKTAGDCITYAITSQTLPSAETWYSCIAGGAQSWRQALFTQDILWGRRRHASPFRQIFTPRPHMSVDIIHPNDPYRTVMVLRLADSKIPEVARVSACNNSSIRLDIFEKSQLTGKTLELPLRFSYHPDIPFLPIRERLEVRNLRIKQFYYKLWFGEVCDFTATPATDFLGDEMTITKEAVRKFTKTLRIGSASSSNKGGTYAPIDMAMVIAWKALTKPLFLKVLDGDLIRLVHLSNKYERIADVEPIRVGDVVSSKARVREIANTDSGVRVEVSGQIIRSGQAVLNVVTQFLYRGTTVDDKIVFKEKDEPIMEQHLKTATDVSILTSKSWFDLQDNDFDLLDARLQYRLRSRTSTGRNGQSKRLTTYGHVLAKGAGFEKPIVIANVNYEIHGAHGNPVMEYLARHATIADRRVLLDLPPPKRVLPIVIPASNEEYAMVSGDFNPIHVSSAFSQLASLPGTITHGMYTCATARNLVQSWEGDNSIDHFHSFTCSFVGMVLPRDNLRLEIQHIGMIGGRKIFSVVVLKDDTSETVLQGEAEIEEPRTAYVFTGQGSQEQGMGMELYAKSPVAKALWDKADAHLMERFGFSILHIVRNNPKVHTVKFGGPRGRQIHQHYLDLKISTVQPDGTIADEPILKNLTPDSTSYTFRSPTGLIFATQFAQVAMVLQEKAAFEDMRAHGLIRESSQFAGHSLGEYGALAAMGDVMPIEQVLFIVFYRGLTMQTSMERDAAGRTEYSMCAVNPSRLSAGFDEECLKLVVAKIARDCNCLLEIVNYNISNQQYVCAGHLVALHTLGTTLDELNTAAHSLKPLFSPAHPDNSSSHQFLNQVITSARAKALKEPTPIVLQRGIATIPLHGVDVPFHSSYLRNGIEPFRAMLLDQIKEQHLDPRKLIGKYIPNLTAKPFDISKEYFEETYALTQSPRLKHVLDTWDQITVGA